jgi:hypothetical protein
MRAGQVIVSRGHITSRLVSSLVRMPCLHCTNSFCRTALGSGLYLEVYESGRTWLGDRHASSGENI